LCSCPDWERAIQQQRRRATIKNRILADLSAADKALLQSDLEPVTFTLRQVLEAPNKPHF
jgi:hypothetical protein